MPPRTAVDMIAVAVVTFVSVQTFWLFTRKEHAAIGTDTCVGELPVERISSKTLDLVPVVGIKGGVDVGGVGADEVFGGIGRGLGRAQASETLISAFIFKKTSIKTSNLANLFLENI